MKISYSSEKVRLIGISLHETHPDLYELMHFEFIKVKKMDWEDFEFYLKEELAKSDKSKRIKRIGKEDLFEFRLPPSSPKGVLRAQFTMECDFYTICITQIFVKNHEPKQQPKR